MFTVTGYTFENGTMGDTFEIGSERTYADALALATRYADALGVRHAVTHGTRGHGYVTSDEWHARYADADGGEYFTIRSTDTRIETGCFCPGDCNCQAPEWMRRAVHCGCAAHVTDA